jgi:hypothetical protein
MIPLTTSVFWGPMAMAIMGGLSVATFLTLVNLPAIYVLIFRIRPGQRTGTEVQASLAPGQLQASQAPLPPPSAIQSFES